MEQTKEQTDAIPESKAACWAWRLSLIPLLGVVLYAVLAAIALYKIGKYGRIGFWYLRRGAIVSMLYTATYFGVYLSGFSMEPLNVYEYLYPGFPMHGVYLDYYKNGQLADRQIWRFGEPHGKWVAYHDNGQKSEEGEYVRGLEVGVWNNWYENGGILSEKQYKEGRINRVKRWDHTGRLHQEYQYDDNNKVIIILDEPLIPGTPAVVPREK